MCPILMTVGNILFVLYLYDKLKFGKLHRILLSPKINNY